MSAVSLNFDHENTLIHSTINLHMAVVTTISV